MAYLSSAFDMKVDRKSNIWSNPGFSSKEWTTAKYQTGFRANYSTDTYLAQSTDLILNSAENDLHTGITVTNL